MPAPRAAGSPLRRLAALAVAAAAVLLPAIGSTTSYAETPSPPPAPGASPSPSPNDDAPAQVLITKLAPRAPLDPQGFFQVRGFVVNRGSQTLRGLTVRLRRGDKLSTRGELATADREPPATLTRIGTPVRTAVSDLHPGASTTFDIRIRIRQLQLGAIGVYPLKVEARAQFGGSGIVDTLGGSATYLPWFPDAPPAGRIRLAWLWPLVDQPRRGPNEVMLDNELATSFGRGGRLDRMLRSAADGARGGCDLEPDPPATLPRPPRTSPCRGDAVPMTYAVDPDLLFTAEALTRPYLQYVGGRTSRVEDTRPARGWLDGLREAAGRADVLSLPYADPDTVALTSPGNALADEVPLLREQGKNETASILGRPPMTSVVWPPAGRLTRRSVEALTSGGATALVVDPLALPTPTVCTPRCTPGADAGVLPTNTGQPRVLRIDTVLSDLLTAAPADYPGDRVVEQRWLVETAMISAEAPSVSRTILVAPPRRADLRTAVAADAIRDTGRLPWLCPVSLASVAAGRDSCPSEAVTERPAAPAVELEPPRPGDPALSGDFLRRVREVRGISTQFTDEVLAEPTSPEAVGTTGRLLRARARTESSAWWQRPADGERLLAQLHGDLLGLRRKVHLQVGSGTVTLTSSTGVISVNVVNELQQPVRVGVALDARNSARLSTRDTPITTVRPESAAQINLKVTAQTSGAFQVTAQLVDRNRRPFGDQVQLVVRSTQYGRVALAVTGIGAAVLLVAAGVRIARRALRRGTT